MVHLRLLFGKTTSIAAQMYLEKCHVGPRVLCTFVRMRQTTVLLVGLALLVWQNGWSQTALTDTTIFPRVPLGSWQQYLPWQRARSVAQSADKVYFATEWAVVEFAKADAGRTPRFLTKVEGLSEAGIDFIRYHRATNTLFVVYTNSNIDLWNAANGDLENLPFLVRNANLAGKRKLYDVVFQGKFAYVVGSFGMFKMDMERRDLLYTTFTDEPARAVAIVGDFLYLGTEEGLFRLPINDVNPADFGRWQVVSGQNGLPSGAVTALAAQGNQLFVAQDRTVYTLNGNTVQTIVTDAKFAVQYLTTEGDGLLIGYRREFDGRIVYRAADGTLRDVHSTCEAKIPLYAIEDGRGKFWIADLSEDFRAYDLTRNQCERFRFNSPFNHFSTDIAIQGNRVYVATPGSASNLEPVYGFWGVYIFEKGQWRNFNGDTQPSLKTGDCDRDLWRVAPHPTQLDKFYAGSFVGGLVESSGNEKTVRCFTQRNSTLQNAGASGSNRTAIGALAFDADGNLWIANYGAQTPIAVLRTDGKIINLPAPDATENAIRLVVDQNGYKWFVLAFSGGLLVYDSGRNLDATNDDRYRAINTANSVLPTNSVNCVAVDQDGDVWVGTQQGLVAFECGSNVFDANLCKGTRPVITLDGFGANVLETENVRVLAVDGANRKWCGTTNGIFVLAPNGKTELAHYTTTNSPLFDNTITALAIHPKTGEVWIGTEKGIQSLRAEATTGGAVSSRQVYAYPNPVRPDYDGPIAIYGLARDANVKITDISGNLVYEGTALGGQAVWNGRDYTGRRVASGVYLIYATSNTLFDKPDTVMAKVVIVR